MTTWTLPKGYTASQIVYAVRHARQHPGDFYRTTDGVTLTADAYICWFRVCLNRKINRNLPPRGKKCASDGYLSDYERHARLFARQVNTPRRIVRVSEAPYQFRERLAHRLYRPEDF